MSGKVIDKQLIESIVRKKNDEYIDKVSEKVNLIVSNAIDDLSHQISYINLDNVIFQPVNELLNGAFTDNSKFVYFLGIDSAQLELNTLKSTNFWKELKNTIIYAWQHRNTRRARRKEKKRKKKEAENSNLATVYDFDPSKYNIYKACEDLQTAIAKFSALTSIVYLENNRLRVVGKEDYGANTQIIIYPVIYNGENYKYYAGRRKGFVEVDINSRIEKLSAKFQKTGESLIDMIKVFNVLYFYANKTMPNQIFIESILCSCPDELFKGDDAYTIFVKIINYLTMTSIKNVKSLTNPNKTIFTDPLSASSGLGYEKFINQFVYLNEKEEMTEKDKISLEKFVNKNKNKKKKTAEDIIKEHESNKQNNENKTDDKSEDK